ncbi:hypothetical protein O9992_10795 [Vibrio lentus]|nr:hypothetical protein [Vibrio lentus]
MRLTIARLSWLKSISGIFGLDTPIKKRSQVVEEMYPYIEREIIEWCKPRTYFSSHAWFIQSIAGCKTMASLHQ